LSAHADSNVIVAAIAEQLRGVGQFCHDPDSVPLVWSAGIVCAEHSPARIIPHCGQVSENSSKPARSEHWGVFHEDVARSHLANDSHHVVPHSASLSVNSGAFSGCADVLAGKPSRYHVNTSAPRSAVKGANVIPNRERRENAFILSGDKNACGVGFPLDGANCAPSEEVPAKYSATSARE
jgi:hypothetical protein